MTQTAKNQDGEAIPAIQYGSSVVVATGSSSVPVVVPSSLFTITVNKDSWIRVGGSADGLNGCDLIPAGIKWSEAVQPGVSVGITTVDGTSGVAVLRFSV